MSGFRDFMGDVFNDVRGDLGNAYSEILTQHSPISADYDKVPYDTWPSAPEPLTGEALSPDWDFAPGEAIALEGQIIDADFDEIQEPLALPSNDRLSGPDEPPQIKGPDLDDHGPEDV